RATRRASNGIQVGSPAWGLCREGGIGMQTVGIILNVGTDQADEFERGFREMEAPTWAELHGLGKLTMATLSRLDISTKTVKGAVQYLVVAIFSDDEGHHLHDDHPRFKE